MNKFRGLVGIAIIWSCISAPIVYYLNRPREAAIQLIAIGFAYWWWSKPHEN